MTERTEVEQDFIDDVDKVPGFHLRTDGIIEREVNEEETPGIRGQYYRFVELISHDDYLNYMRNEIEEEERSLGEFVQK